jgi:ribosomal protein eS8
MRDFFVNGPTNLFFLFFFSILKAELPLVGSLDRSELFARAIISQYGYDTANTYMISQPALFHSQHFLCFACWCQPSLHTDCLFAALCAYVYFFCCMLLSICINAGISRDSRHKRRATGGRRNIHQKKRKFELGRPAAETKMGAKRVHVVRARGGNLKFRAMRLDTGNFAWGTETCTRKTRILDVVYNASNNELVSSFLTHLLTSYGQTANAYIFYSIPYAHTCNTFLLLIVYRFVPRL